MKTEKESLLTWREWAHFGARWVLLALLAAGIYLTRSQSSAADPSVGLVPALALGAVANIVLALMLLIPSARLIVSPVILIGDFVTAAAFVMAAQGEPLLVLTVVASLMLTGMLSFNVLWGGLHVIGLLGAAFVGLVLALGTTDALSLLSTTLTVPLILLVGLGVITVIGEFVSDKLVGAQQRRILELARGETSELEAMRERTRALYELSSTMSSSLSVSKVLDAVLDAGRLGMKSDPRDDVISLVLLFRPSNNALQVAASRRLTRSDETTLIPGVDGIVGEALSEGMPIFAESAKKDPELRAFTSLQFCRSILCVPMRANFENYGVMVYGSTETNAFNAEDVDLLTAVGHQATMAMQNAVLYSRVLEEKERLVDLQESERKQLARDLHDGPTQSVAAIAMRMGYIYKLLEKKPEEVPDELKKVEEIARKTVKEIRHMLFTLRPLVLESQGLTAALDQLAEKMQETFGQRVAVRVGKDVEKILTTQQQGVLFYVVEEAVNNARKHAQAELIKVAIARQGETMICQIADTGVGFNLNAVDASYDRRGSLGMVNMRERAELLDASIHIDSAEGKGTTITLAMPLKPNPAAAPSNGSAHQNNSNGNGKQSHPAANRIIQRTR